MNKLFSDMKTNKPEVVAIKDSDVGGLIELKPVSRLPHGARLIRLSDYEALKSAHEEELFCIRQDRDAHFGELMRALEQVDAMKAECEKLRTAMIEAKGHIDHYMYGGSSYRKPAAEAIALIDAALAVHRKGGEA